MTRRPLQIELTTRAFDDLTHIRDYLIARSPQGAENVRLAINATLDQLQHFPMTGRDRPDLKLRSIGVARYAYTIFHRVHEDRVEIVHVRDDRRKPLEPGDL